jgi:hypothetical protein
MPVKHRSSVAYGFTIEYILCLALTGAPHLWAQKPPYPSTPNCAVKGTVTDGSTGQPLKRAYVRLEPILGTGATYPAVTDDEGKFTIQDVTPASYRLVAEKQGFLDGRYGGLTADVELRLSGGENVAGLNISLTPQAVISGRVLDEDGEPWSHAVANLYRSVWKRGKRELEGFNSQDADDQGNFRIAQLPPGRYYAVAVPDTYWENRNRPAHAPHNQPTWYPSSANAHTATEVVLRAGEERKGIDIRLRRSVFFHIRGKVTGVTRFPSSNEPEPYSRPRLSATQTSDLSNNAASYSGTLRPDGSFEFSAVPAGIYEIQVARGFPSAVTLGHTTVRVDDQDVENISIDAAQAHPIKGGVQLEGEGPFDPTGLLVWLDSVDDAGGGLGPVAVREDGGFDFAQVGSATYRVRLSGHSANLVYLKKLQYGDFESLDGTLFAASNDTLTLILSTHGARLTGKVKNADEHRTAPKVVLIPDTENSAWREYGTRVAAFDQYGAFSVVSIAPGAYHLYAFENIPDDSWEDPDLLREISDKGAAFHFEEGDAESIEIPVIPHSDLSELLARLGIE